MKGVLIDSGSSTDVLFLNALKNMRKSENDLNKVNFPLIVFTLTTIYPMGAITLSTFFGEG